MAIVASSGQLLRAANGIVRRHSQRLSKIAAEDVHANMPEPRGGI